MSTDIQVETERSKEDSGYSYFDAEAHRRINTLGTEVSELRERMHELETLQQLKGNGLGLAGSIMEML